LTALGGSPPTPAGGVLAPVVLVENLTALEELLKKDAGAVRGKIVFFNERMARTRDGSGYGKTVAIRGRGSKAAAAAGASGALVRTVGTSQNRLPHTGGMEAGGPYVPAAALSSPDADLLERLVSAGGPVQVRFTLGCRTLPDAPARNIVGEVPGSGKGVVVLGAHLDSWDLGQGAIDDGAGVGIVAEAARVLLSASHPLARTVRVVLYANEENGTAGAKAYAEAHKPEADDLVGALEMDLGTDRVFSFGSLTGPEGEGAVLAIAELLKPLGITERSPEGFAGTDVSTLRPLGVPVFSLHQDASRYFDIHHSADDTFDKVDPAQLQQAVASVVTFAAVAADMPGTFGRVPLAKRKAEEH
jgi:hypothetical protein